MTFEITMKKIPSFVGAVILVVFTMQSTSQAAASKNKNGQIQTIVAKGKKTLAALLNDPESVRFMDLDVTESIDPAISIKTLCGRFNAKNSYGGYGAPELFFVGIRSDGSVDGVWLKDKTDLKQRDDEGDISYVMRNLDYKNRQNNEFSDRCFPKNGKVKTIWTGK